MAREMSREERKKAFLKEAEVMFEGMEDWYDGHPRATFGEIEQEARRRRRQLMGTAMAIFVNGRDTGKQEEAPLCPQCEQGMVFKGYRGWTVSGLEGDTRLERAYYTCWKCKSQTFFPPA